MDEGSMPSPYDALRFELMELRRRAGNPPYRQLAAAGAAAAGKQLPLTLFSASTVADNLNGRRRSMSLEFVRFFVHGCWAYAGQKKFALPAGDLSWPRWHGLWRAQAPACELAPPVPLPPPGAGGAGGAGRADTPGPRALATEREHRRTPGRRVVSPGRFVPVQVGRAASDRQNRTTDLFVSRGYADGPQLCSSDWGGLMESPIMPAARAGSRPVVAPTRVVGGAPEPVWLYVLRLCAEVIDADPLLSAQVRAASAAARTGLPPRGRTGPGSGRPNPQGPSGRTRGAVR